MGGVVIGGHPTIDTTAYREQQLLRQGELYVIDRCRHHEYRLV